MRRFLIGAGVIGALALAGSAQAQAQVVHYTAKLSGASEVPALKGGKGRGSFSADLDTATHKLNYKLEFSGLTGPATGAHIHGPGGPAVNAPHIVMIGAAMEGMSMPMGTVMSPTTGSATLTSAQIAALKAGELYVNVHTAAHPEGEIRGQLLSAKP